MTRIATCKTCEVDFVVENEGPLPGHCSNACITNGTRICSVCEQSKATSEFYKDGIRRGIQQYKGHCKDCHRDIRREKDIRYTYNTTVEALENVLASQNGLCAICDSSLDGGYHIDHDHNCCSEKKTSCGNCIRGLLCGRCNVGIGMLQDNPDVMISAAMYVLKTRDVLTNALPGR